MIPRLVSAAELAKRLNVHPSHLHRLGRTGKISCYRVGHRMLFDEKEVLGEIRRPACLQALHDAGKGARHG